MIFHNKSPIFPDILEKIRVTCDYDKCTFIKFIFISIHMILLSNMINHIIHISNYLIKQL